MTACRVETPKQDSVIHCSTDNRIVKSINIMISISLEAVLRSIVTICWAVPWRLSRSVSTRSRTQTSPCRLTLTCTQYILNLKVFIVSQFRSLTLRVHLIRKKLAAGWEVMYTFFDEVIFHESPGQTRGKSYQCIEFLRKERSVHSRINFRSGTVWMVLSAGF